MEGKRKDKCENGASVREMGEARTDVVSRKLSTIVAAILAVDLSLGSVGRQ